MPIGTPEGKYKLRILDNSGKWLLAMEKLPLEQTALPASNASWTHPNYHLAIANSASRNPVMRNGRIIRS